MGNEKTRREYITKEDTRREAFINHVETVLENQRLNSDHWLRREHNHICVKSLRVYVSGIRLNKM